jgi:hypothetical protein
VLVGSTLRWMHGATRTSRSTPASSWASPTTARTPPCRPGTSTTSSSSASSAPASSARSERRRPSRLRSDELGVAQQRALGFDRPSGVRAEWLLEPSLKGFNLQEAESTLRQVLSYRVWFDQRRGWRYTNPNLEQLGLVEVDYLGLDALAADDEEFETAPDVLGSRSPRARAAVYRELLDHLRKWMAIRARSSSRPSSSRCSRGRTAASRALGLRHRREAASGAVAHGLAALAQGHNSTLRDEDLIVRGGSRSALGKLLRASTSPSGADGSGNGRRPVRALKSKDFDALILALLRAACVHGLVSEENTPFGNQAGLAPQRRLRSLSGTPVVDPIRSQRERLLPRLLRQPRAHARAPVHPLFGFEAREHTAQVDGEKRAVREKRFRYGEKEREELAADEKHLREIGEANRFLPVLFCSPTMELGVDISALNAVYLRNVPPTPRTTPSGAVAPVAAVRPRWS